MIKMQNLKQAEADKGIYEDPAEYISEELEKIDLMLELAILRQRTKKDAGKDALAGLYISEGEIDELLNKGEIEREEIEKTPEGPLVTQLEQAIERHQELITRKSDITKKEGIISPIEHLKRLFGLTPFEIDALLLCLAPATNTKYEKLYAYLQDDITKKYPTLNLIFLLLTRTLKERNPVRQYFSPHAPLIRWQILKFGGDHSDAIMSPLSSPIHIDERIVDFLLGSPFLDPAIAEGLNVLQPEGDIDTLHIKEALKQKLNNLVSHLQEDKGRSNTVIFLYGTHGVGKTNAATAISRALNIPLLEVNIRHLLKDEGTFLETVKRIIREALLLQCALLIKDFDALLSGEGKVSYFREHLLKEISKFSYLTFLTGEQNWEPTVGLKNARYIKIHFPVPDFLLRKSIWEKALNGRNNFTITLTPDDLANKFKFTEGQIRAAIATAKDRTFFHSCKEDSVANEDLLIGCRQQSSQKLSELSLKITPKYSWQDIVLPEDQFAQLREICNHLKYRHIVYGEWGFEKKISLGKGLNVLFSGPSGTGKTMAAEIIANELKLDMYKIDLSQVISKYIGETEKNLSKIFKEAETSNAILFFDEADALFGKRSEVKDSHDRYANIETSYLLQKMEEYEGIVILATNLSQNIDEAFKRRLHFLIEFPFPDENHRYLIWKEIFPKEAPVDGVDFEFMAKNFKLSGGNIKNIAIHAAFLAAQDSRKINMVHLTRAIKREYQKIGKLCVQSDFGKYYELVAGTKDISEG